MALAAIPHMEVDEEGLLKGVPITTS
jgi:hypothetical protein